MKKAELIELVAELSYEPINNLELLEVTVNNVLYTWIRDGYGNIEFWQAFELETSNDDELKAQAVEYGDHMVEVVTNEVNEIATVTHYDGFGNPHRLAVIGNSGYYCTYGYEYDDINRVRLAKTKKELNGIEQALKDSNGEKITVTMLRLAQVLRRGLDCVQEERMCTHILQQLNSAVTWTDALDCYEFNGLRSSNPLTIAKYIELSK